MKLPLKMSSWLRLCYLAKSVNKWSLLKPSILRRARHRLSRQGNESKQWIISFFSCNPRFDDSSPSRISGVVTLKIAATVHQIQTIRFLRMVQKKSVINKYGQASKEILSHAATICLTGWQYGMKMTQPNDRNKDNESGTNLMIICLRDTMCSVSLLDSTKHFILLRSQSAGSILHWKSYVHNDWSHYHIKHNKLHVWTYALVRTNYHELDH